MPTPAPNSPEAEMSVLGSMILSPIAATECAGLLTEPDFYRPAHRLIFKTLRTLHATKTNLDLVLIESALGDEGLTAIGGAGYLLEIAAYVPSAANCRFYCGIVAEKAERRRLMSAAKQLHQMAGNGEAIGEVRDYARSFGSMLAGDEAGGPVQASSIVEKPLQWLAYPYLAMGTLATLDGDPGRGKTFVLEAIPSAMSIGAKLPWCEEPLPKLRSLLVVTEDSAEHVTIKRLRRLGADLGMIDIIDESWGLDRAGLDRLYRYCAGGYGFVGLDPLLDFIDPVTKGVRPTITEREIMVGLKTIAEQCGPCIAANRHLVKPTGHSTNPIYRATGSIALIGKVRNALMFNADPADPECRRKGCISHYKHNLGPEGRPFAFEIREDGREADLFWTGFRDGGEEPRSRGRPPAKRTDAVAFLRSLYQGSTLMLASTVMERGEAEGFSRNTLDRAFKSVGGFSTKDGYRDGRYRWFLPPEDDPHA